MKGRTHANRGFSLLELVVVVVILGIIAAVAIPRLSRGSAGAAETALSGDLAVLRNAVELYSAEHGGAFPPVTTVADQLTRYTDDQGNVNATKDTTYIYGPYLVKVPPLPVGVRKNATKIAEADANDVGWIYNETTGHIRANCTDTEKDARGTLFKDY
jgi:prepilin-type N-terminal cleavage/methylation domain-containing protein